MRFECKRPLVDNIRVGLVDERKCLSEGQNEQIHIIAYVCTVYRGISTVFVVVCLQYSAAKEEHLVTMCISSYSGYDWDGWNGISFFSHTASRFLL